MSKDRGVEIPRIDLAAHCNGQGRESIPNEIGTMISILSRKSILSLAARTKAAVKSCLALAILLTLMGAVASHEAHAQLRVGGGTLNYNVTDEGTNACSDTGFDYMTTYQYFSFSFTSSTGVVTQFPGASVLDYVWDGNCQYGTPQWGDPAILYLYGPTFYITLDPSSFTATYSQNPATPTFSPAGGTFTTAQTVTISDATSGTTIYYTTNGTTPTTSSTVYGAPITVSSSKTVEAIAIDSNYVQSTVGSAAYTINLNLAAQTITFPAIPTQTVGTPLTLSATASSGLAVGFASTTTSICTVSGTTATFIASGTCTIQATQAGNSTYAAAPLVSQSFTVNGKAQTITFTAPTTPVTYSPGQTYTPSQQTSYESASASPPTYSQTNSGTLSGFSSVAATSAELNVTISGSVSSSSGSGAGVLTLQYSTNNGSTFTTVTAWSSSFSSQVVSFPISGITNLNTVQIQITAFAATGSGSASAGVSVSGWYATVGAPPITLSATASSGLPVTFSVTSGPGTVSGNSLTITGAGTVVVAANQAGNASYSAAATVSHTIVVNKATLTVTANNASRAYGAANPTFTPRYSGFLNGDTASVLTGAPSLTTTATASSAVGSYTITAAAGTLAATNYSFTYVNGTLTVSKAVLTVTANNASRAYGAANPTFTPRYSGFLNGDTASVLTGAPSLTTTATASSAVGSYTITAAAGTLAATNYSFTYVNGTLTVSKAVLTVTANNASRAYGAANPTFTPRYSGFLNGDTASVLTGAPSLTTTATASSAVGSYTITAAAGTLAATNYSFTYVNGTLTVNKTTLTITASSPTVTYGAAIPAITPSYSGFVNGDTSASLTTQPACTTSYTTTSAAGSSPSTSCSGAATANYTVSYVSGAVTINPATPNLTVATSVTPSAYNSPVTFMATISSGTTGSVNFYDGNTLLGSNQISGTTATYTTKTLALGAHIISTSYSGDANHYSVSSGSITQTITQATPIITWTAPAPVGSGTVLLETQLNATANVPGTFAYTPPEGTVITAAQTLSVVFTPKDAYDYTTASATVPITLRTGADADTGTATLTINAANTQNILTVSINYGAADTPSTIAERLAAASSSSLVNVAAVDNALNIEASPAAVSSFGGAGTNFSYSLQFFDTAGYNSASFAATPPSGALDGGSTGGSGQSSAAIYSFNGSYDPVGNLTSYTDSVMGIWSFAYDTLNRLATATAASAAADAAAGVAAPYAGNYGCWSYDAFGNRTMEAMSTTACTSNPAPASWANLSPGNNNRLAGTNQAPGGVSYDASGDVLNDGVNQYLYDAEGRICAVASTPIPGMTVMTGYLYDAGGTRVAKGSIQKWSCDPAASGFQTINDYVLGLGGEQVTEMGMGSATTGSTMSGLAWQHTNVWAGGKLLGTYDNDGLHFYLDDPLGTRRVQTDYAGVVEKDCASLPYGDGESCAPTPTEHLFTGKERDSESGNDYFGARYYTSSIGRMMSPDSGVDQHPEDPQSWNLYSYVRNNPLNSVDPSGEFTCDSKTVSATQCANAHASDDKAGAALDKIKAKYGADSSQYKDAARAHDALGGTKDNGVVLSIGNAGKDAEGKTTIGPMQAKTDDNPNGQNIKITLGAGEFDGSAGAATSIEHEGFHAADAHDWINTGFNPSAAPNWYQSEFHAFSVQFNLMTAMGITGHPLNGVGIVGAGAPDSQNFQGFMIHAILRQSPYRMDPSNKLTMWQKNTQGGH